MEILFGSGNKDKFKEVSELFKDEFSGGIELLSVDKFGLQNFDVEETGNTLEENAFIKAKAYFDKANFPCFADDTGLEIMALNGEPGIYSARYAGEGCTYEDNCNLVLERLKGVEDSVRQAMFRTVICYYDGETKHFVEGICKGHITVDFNGRGGFGYDPIFVPDGYDVTFSDMTMTEKNKISHRGFALKGFIEHLKGLT